MSDNGLRVEVEVPATTVVVELHDRGDWTVAYGTEGEAAITDAVRESVRTVLDPDNVKGYGAFGSGEVKATITPVRPRMVSIKLDDGRIVDVFASGAVQVYTPDKRHGGMFVVPAGAESGGSFGMLVRRLG
jgi:hypothetical protein